MKKNISILVEEKVVKKIDQLADRFDLSRSQMVENLMSVGLVDAQVLELIGMIDLAKMVGRVKEAVERKSKKSSIT